MALEEVLDRIFDVDRHMDLCMAEVVNCGIDVDYVPNHRELIPFVWNTSKQSHVQYAVNVRAYNKGCGQIRW